MTDLPDFALQQDVDIKQLAKGKGSINVTYIGRVVNNYAPNGDGKKLEPKEILAMYLDSLPGRREEQLLEHLYEIVNERFSSISAKAEFLGVTRSAYTQRARAKGLLPEKRGPKQLESGDTG